MHMPANNGGSDFAPPPSGTHIAVCIRLIDLGTQKQEWQGQVKLQRKVLLSWELPEEKMDDGRPFTISQRYTFSSSEKATLRHHLESWRGRRFQESDFGPGGFDIKNVLGKPCMLNIVHKDKDGKTYANIGSVSAMPKGMTAPATQTQTTYLSLAPGAFDHAVFQTLSENLQATIKNSPEYADLMAPPPASEADYEAYRGPDLDDEIPF